MGESSPKSLRGGGMDDVIFAGTASRPQRDFAEVSILIERGAGDEGGAGESEVTRRIERGAGSAYRIDGRDVRAKDVALLFADAATGAHSPALVSQGKIGAVISAKPVERRMLLEEAAGISGLHARRKDAEQKLRAAEVNLVRLGEILGDQEQRAAQLRRQARAAERYRKLTDQIRGHEARLLHARWVGAERAAEAAAAEAQSRGRRRRTHSSSDRRRTGRPRPGRAALAERRAALTRIREQGHAQAHQLPPPGRDATRSAGGWPSSPSWTRRSEGDIAREQSLKADAERAIALLEAERSTIAARLDDSEAHSARIAAELTAAEAASREAETALAELLARQAAMRAERRVAEAALEAARAQHARTQQERKSLRISLGRSATEGSRRRAREEAEAKANAGNADIGRGGSRARRGRGRTRGGGRTPRFHRKRARVGASGAFPRHDRNTRRWLGRSSMAAERRSPALGPSPAMSARSRLRWGRTPTRRSAGTAPAAGGVRRCCRAIPRCRQAGNASPTM